MIKVNPLGYFEGSFEESLTCDGVGCVEIFKPDFSNDDLYFIDSEWVITKGGLTFCPVCRVREIAKQRRAE